MLSEIILWVIYSNEKQQSYHHSKEYNQSCSKVSGRVREINQHDVAGGYERTLLIILLETVDTQLALQYLYFTV